MNNLQLLVLHSLLQHHFFLYEFWYRVHPFEEGVQVHQPTSVLAFSIKKKCRLPSSQEASFIAFPHGTHHQEHNHRCFLGSWSHIFHIHILRLVQSVGTNPCFTLLCIIFKTWFCLILLVLVACMCVGTEDTPAPKPKPGMPCFHAGGSQYPCNADGCRRLCEHEHHGSDKAYCKSVGPPGECCCPNE